MKIRKVLAGLLLAFLMLLALPVMTSADTVTSGSCGENVTWSYEQATKTLIISGEGEMDNYIHPQISSYYHLRDFVERIVIRPGVTHIGNCAFGTYSALKSVSLPDTLVSVGTQAFEQCKQLSKIVIPDSVTKIGSMAFYYCEALADITLPQKATVIENHAFAGCSLLNKIELPSGIKSISGGLFWCCSSLETVVVPEGVTRIEQNAFRQCDSLRKVALPNSVEFLGHGSFMDSANLSEITIPKNVSVIMATAFNGCTGLEKIIFCGNAPAITITAYDRYAFAGVEAVAWYPYGNSTWDDSVNSDFWYGGSFTWQPYLVNVTVSKVIPHTSGNILYWDAVPGGDIYQIYRLRSGETSWTLLKNTRSLGYKDETAVAGIKYYYKIVARNGDVKSDIKTTASVGMVRPSANLANVTIYKTLGHSTGNIIYWNAVSNAKLYQVYRLENGQWVLLKNTGSLAYKDETALSGVKYYYKIVARNGEAKSNIATTASASAIRP